MKYKTKGVCSSEINFEIDNNIIQSINFVGGCNGNLSGICKLVTGMNVNDVIDKLEGTKCGFKNTSCPDQLAKALRQYLANK